MALTTLQLAVILGTGAFCCIRTAIEEPIVVPRLHMLTDNNSFFRNFRIYFSTNLDYGVKILRESDSKFKYAHHL